MLRLTNSVMESPLLGVPVGEVAGLNVYLALAVLPVPFANQTLGIGIALIILRCDELQVVRREHDWELPGGITVDCLDLFRADEIINRLGIRPALPFLFYTQSYLAKSRQPTDI